MRNICHLSLILTALLTVSTLKAEPVVKVACVGNSITQGSTIKNEHRDSYPGLLSQMLGKRYEVRNYGFSGRTMLDKGNLPYMKEQMYQDALAFCPDIVTIKLGTNDTKPMNWQYKEEYPKNLETMVRAFQALESHPKIYICYPVPAYSLDWGINDSIIRTEVCPYIDSIAALTGAQVVDLYQPFTNHPELFNDRIHPNEEGALGIATILYKVITGRPLPGSFQPQSYPGVKETWEGYDCYHFNFKEHQGKLVIPAQPAEGNPWIWRPAFFGAFAQADKALLEKGYFVVYYDVADDYASLEALKAGDQLYKYLTKHYGFSKKMVIEGFSRGGMYAIDWAAMCPHKVAGLYLDAPVCDVYSWPGNDRPQWNAEWNQFLAKWKLDGSDMSGFNGNPLDCLEPIAEKNIPVLLVAGKKDKVVPYKENGALLVKKYRALGGNIDVILKKKCDHHPHSLDNPQPIVDFVEKAFSENL